MALIAENMAANINFVNSYGHTNLSSSFLHSLSKSLGLTIVLIDQVSILFRFPGRKTLKLAEETSHIWMSKKGLKDYILIVIFCGFFMTYQLDI